MCFGIKVGFGFGNPYNHIGAWRIQQARCGNGSSDLVMSVTSVADLLVENCLQRRGSARLQPYDFKVA
jgi:hypothetical protein